jgi:exodeoxyribonuclease V alpha subunit
MTTQAAIKYLYDSGRLTDIDIRFADLMRRLSGESGGHELYLACLLLNNTVLGGQNVCLDFDDWAGKPLLLPPGDDDPGNDIDPDQVRAPAAGEWMEGLAASPVVGAPGDYRPLVLDRPGRRLYLYRYWQYERRLVDGLLERATARPEVFDPDLFRDGLARCFPGPGPAGEIDWQKAAALAALTRRISLITGGPGTGKTFTASRIIRLILEQQPGAAVYLCAPTGKAATRLQTAMADARREMVAAGAGWPEKFPQDVYTIHRLLGASDTDFGFRYHEDRPLPADVVVIDESSMVSLSLMAGLFAALDKSARVILLGDKNQLASVEAGAVFGDICGAAAAAGRFSENFAAAYHAAVGEALPAAVRGGSGGLSDCLVELKQNYRFPAGSPLDAVSRAVNRGDGDEACRLMAGDTSAMVVRRDLPAKAELAERLGPTAMVFWDGLGRAATAEEALAALEDFRILCALRQGPYGVENVNRLVEQALARQGLIDPRERFYRGRPIMIIRNDYSQRLFNGDVGIIWRTADGNRLACFPDPAGRLRTISPLRLPPHETVFAMTIHKSQGSECDRLLMVLPDQVSPLLTRELIYTGLTRARRQVTVWADAAVFKAAVQARLSRRSGLRDALGGA